MLVHVLAHVLRHKGGVVVRWPRDRPLIAEPDARVLTLAKLFALHVLLMKAKFFRLIEFPLQDTAAVVYYLQSGAHSRQLQFLKAITVGGLSRLHPRALNDTHRAHIAFGLYSVYRARVLATRSGLALLKIIDTIFLFFFVLLVSQFTLGFAAFFNSLVRSMVKVVLEVLHGLILLRGMHFVPLLNQGKLMFDVVVAHQLIVARL